MLVSMEESTTSGSALDINVTDRWFIRGRGTSGGNYEGKISTDTSDSALDISVRDRWLK